MGEADNDILSDITKRSLCGWKIALTLLSGAMAGLAIGIRGCYIAFLQLWQMLNLKIASKQDWVELKWNELSGTSYLTALTEAQNSYWRWQTAAVAPQPVENRPAEK